MNDHLFDITILAARRTNGRLRAVLGAWGTIRENEKGNEKREGVRVQLHAICSKPSSLVRHRFFFAAWFLFRIASFFRRGRTRGSFSLWTELR